MLNRFWTKTSGRTPRGVVLFLALFYCITTAVAPAEANSRYASIVVSAYNGKVLFSRNADSRRYPASLTKMMTLYMLFEALEEGRITLQTKMKMSKHASGQAPSKLGLKIGEPITVEEAIRAIVVISANDVASLVGETLSGTEYKFAQDMTKKAWTLGMNRTQFQNATGLHNYRVSWKRNNYTTARDMATLSQRLIHDYPSYYKYFSVKTFKWPYFSKKHQTWKTRTYKSHNSLLKDYGGTDGIKTGYVKASGFNLASSVKRGEDHLIGVVFGGRSTKTRDAHMKQILSDQFKRLQNDPVLSRKIAFIPQPMPKPGSPLASISTQDNSEVMPSLVAKAHMQPIIEEGDTSYTGIDPTDPNADPSDALNASQLSASADPIGDLINIEDVNKTASVPANAEDIKLDNVIVLSSLDKKPEDEQKLSQRLKDSKAFYGIQIGAYGFKELAIQRLNTAAQRAPEILNGVLFTVLPIKVDSRSVYRARIGPYREAEAVNACDTLQNKGITCFTVVQEKWPESTATISAN